MVLNNLKRRLIHVHNASIMGHMAYNGVAEKACKQLTTSPSLDVDAFADSSATDDLVKFRCR